MLKNTENTIVLSKSKAKEMKRQLKNIGVFKCYIIAPEQLLQLPDSTQSDLISQSDVTKKQLAGQFKEEYTSLPTFFRPLQELPSSVKLVLSQISVLDKDSSTEEDTGHRVTNGNVI
jgi:hypothetical protein